MVPSRTAFPAKALGDESAWHLTAIAEYDLRGRVLGTKRYHSGPQAELVPVDVAVGWKQMSDQSVLDQLTI